MGSTNNGMDEKDRLQKMYKAAGMRIQKERDRHGFSREALAEMASISPKFLYEIENGAKGFSAGNLIRISEALNVSCEYLMLGERSRWGQRQALLDALEKFDEGKTEKLAILLESIYEFTKE